MFGNNSIDKIMFLPDDIEIDVSKLWCQKAISYLIEKEMYDEQLDNIVNYLSLCDKKNQEMLFPSRFVRITVGDVKKLINIDNVYTFCCIFPYNYDELANKYLEGILGGIKIQIELLSVDNRIEDCLQLIDNINDGYLKKLSLCYMKYIYNVQTKKIIEDITISRKKAITLINNRLK